MPPSNRGIAIKTILGLLLLLGLSYLGGHPRIQHFEERLGISPVVTAGFPYVALGAIASLPAVDILSTTMLYELMPIFELGLGWIGFTVGFRFDARLLDSLPASAGSLLALNTLVPFATIVGGSSLLLLAAGQSFFDGQFLRDALILGTAGAMTGRVLPRDGVTIVDRTTRLLQLEELIAMVGLVVLGSFFRPHDSQVAWQLPGVGWLFLTLGMGATMGVLVYTVLGHFRSESEFLVVTLGSLSFLAGMASYLRVSAVAVCFIAGVILVNFPGRFHADLRATLHRMERPTYLLFLVVAGALWSFQDWQGWVLLLIFVGMRFAGKLLAGVIARRQHIGDLRPSEQRKLLVGPIGTLSIAIVVTAQDLFQGATVSWIVTAVIGGAAVTEVFVQIANRVRAVGDLPATLPPGVEPDGSIP